MKTYIIRTLATTALILLSVISTAQTGQGRYGAAGGQRPGTARMTGTDKGYINGQVVLSPDEEGGEEIPGAGVVVIVVSSTNDTKHATVASDGRFRISNITPGKAVVQFSLMGYETLENVVDIVRGENRIIANLNPVKEELAAAVVKETVQPIKMIKDTIVFNAAAVKTDKGDMAIDILEQMPGVEVTEDGVKVLGEQVKNVYIDGALLFGNAPMKALNNLSASDVVNIKSYQEYENKDPDHKIRNTEQRARVLDVSTRSHPKYVAMGDFIAGGGFDTDSTYHKFRYTLGADAHLFSEKLQVGGSVNVNNINDDSNRRRGNSFSSASGGGSVDLRNISASARVRRVWMSPTTRNFELGSVMASYSFSDKYDVTESRTQQIYFPGEKFTSREVERTSYKLTTSTAHNVGIAGTKSLKDGSVILTANGRFTTSGGDTRSTNYNTQDGLSPQGTSSVNRSSSNGSGFDTQLNVSKGFRNRIRMDLNGNYSISESGSLSAREDSTTTTLSRQVLDINGTGRSHNYGAGGGLTWEIDDNRSIRLNYDYSDTYNRSERIAMDITGVDPVLDTVNTHTYTTSKIDHNAALSFDNYFESIGATLRLSAGFVSSTLGRDEEFPTDWDYDRPFNSWKASARFGTDSQINRWEASISTSAGTPSLEQVRPKIDNTNLFSVSAGNPLLQQNRTINMDLGWSTVFGEESISSVLEQEAAGRSAQRYGRGAQTLTTLDIRASLNIGTAPIVMRQMYYTEETYLPEFNYTMPAQSTFTTYENAPDKSWSASINARFGTPLEKIMWMLSVSTSLNWDRSPSYVDYQLTNTSNFRPSVNVSMRSNFSRKVRLNASVNGSYIYSDNSLRDRTSYFRENINLGWEFNQIFKVMYIGGNYYKVFTQNLEHGSFNDNIFNARIGARFGPKNNLDISVNVHDLFNTTTGFSTSMTSNYISNVWNRQFGRYVMFTLAYRFNQGGSGQGGRSR